MRLNRQECIIKTPLWYNNNIKDDNIFFYPNWIRSGILILNHLMKNSDNFTFLSKIWNWYQFSTIPWTNMSIKRYLRNLEIKPETLSYPFIPKWLEIFFKRKKGVKNFYRFIITPSTTPTGTRQNLKLY